MTKSIRSVITGKDTGSHKTLTVPKLFIFASYRGSYYIRSLNIPVQFTSVSLQPAPYSEKTEKKLYLKPYHKKLYSSNIMFYFECVII